MLLPCVRTGKDKKGAPKDMEWNQQENAGWKKGKQTEE